MKITKSAIVSNSAITKNYKAHRDLAEALGKIFVFKNNQPDAVLFSIAEYERLSSILESIELMNESEIAFIVKSIQKKEWVVPA